MSPSGKHFSAETNYCWMILSDLIYFNGLKKIISSHFPTLFFFQFYHANEYMPSRIIIVKSSNFLKIKSFKLSRWCFSHYKFSMIITYVRHKIKALSVKYCFFSKLYKDMRHEWKGRNTLQIICSQISLQKHPLWGKGVNKCTCNQQTVNTV